MNLLSIYFFYYYKEFLDWRDGNCYGDCYYKDYFDTWREVMLLISLFLLLSLILLLLLLFLLTKCPLLFDSSNKSFSDLTCLTPTVLLFSLLPSTLFLLNLLYNNCICCSKLSIIFTLFLPRFAIFLTYNWCCWL